MAVLDAALEYASRGFAVLPIHTSQNGQCSCGDSECHAEGKHPRTPRGVQDASTDEKTIRRWWKRWPDANLAIACGQSNIVVIDLDDDIGEASWEQLGIEVENTWICNTPKGKHLYFLYNEKKSLPGILARNIDIKSGNGYVVAPPSVNGESKYVWVVGPDQMARPRAMPDELFAAIIQVRSKSEAPPLPEVFQEGQRLQWLLSLAGTMRRRNASEDAILDAIRAENTTRCRPPLDEEELVQIAKGVQKYKPKVDANKKQADSVATQLVQMAEEFITDYFTDQLNAPFVRIPVEDHFETWSLRSPQLSEWLAKTYYDATQSVPRGQAVSDAKLVISGRCREGEQKFLYNRVAPDSDGSFWYDMTTPEWNAVHITDVGWEIIPDPPILFRRYAHQHPQCLPQAGGDFDTIFEFLNMPDDPELQRLLQIYIISSFIPNIPHPILNLAGPQGSAKSSFCRVIRRLVDPSITGTLSLPKDQRELVQQLMHNWVAYYDNLSVMSEWISDTLCKACTGEGISKRALYTDEDDVIFQYQRVVGINGIVNTGMKADLLDRSIVLELLRIPNSDRRTEAELGRALEEAMPGIFGGALNALVRALQMKPHIKLQGRPRMADFVEWGAAISHDPQEFLGAYEHNIDEAEAFALEAQPFAQAVLAMMAGREKWEGTSAGLLEQTTLYAAQQGIATDSDAWPRTAVWGTRRLKEAAANLESAGIKVHTKAGGGPKTIRIWRVNDTTGET